MDELSPLAAQMCLTFFKLNYRLEHPETHDWAFKLNNLIELNKKKFKQVNLKINELMNKRYTFVRLESDFSRFIGRQQFVSVCVVSSILNWSPAYRWINYSCMHNFSVGVVVDSFVMLLLLFHLSTSLDIVIHLFSPPSTYSIILFQLFVGFYAHHFDIFYGPKFVIYC